MLPKCWSMSFSSGSFFRFLSDEELQDEFKIRSQLITLSVSDISKKSNQPVNFFQTVFFFRCSSKVSPLNKVLMRRKRRRGSGLSSSEDFLIILTSQDEYIQWEREKCNAVQKKSEEFQGFLHQEKNSWVGWLDLAWVCCVSDLHHFGEEYVLWYFVEQYILRYSSEKYYETFWCGCFHPYTFLPLAVEMEQF